MLPTEENNIFGDNLGYGVKSCPPLGGQLMENYEKNKFSWGMVKSHICISLNHTFTSIDNNSAIFHQKILPMVATERYCKLYFCILGVWGKRAVLKT